MLESRWRFGRFVQAAVFLLTCALAGDAAGQTPADKDPLIELSGMITSATGDIDDPANAGLRSRLTAFIARHQGTEVGAMAAAVLSGRTALPERGEVAELEKEVAKHSRAAQAPVVSREMRAQMRQMGIFVPSSEIETQQPCPALPANRRTGQPAQPVTAVSYSRWGLTPDDFAFRASWTDLSELIKPTTTLLHRSARHHCKAAILAWAEAGDVPAMVLASQVLLRPHRGEPADVAGSGLWLERAAAADFGPALYLAALRTDLRIADSDRTTAEMAGHRYAGYIDLIRRAGQRGSKEAEADIAVKEFTGLNIVHHRFRSAVFVLPKSRDPTLLTRITALAEAGAVPAIDFLMISHGLGNNGLRLDRTRAQHWSDHKLKIGAGLCLQTPRDDADMERRSRLCPGEGR